MVCNILLLVRFELNAYREKSKEKDNTNIYNLS